MFTAPQLLEIVNRHIDGLDFSRPPKGLYDPVEYVLSLGGKRIRPVLLLMAYNLYKQDVSKALPPATAIEVYHNCTLLHDDLMDRAEVRRGKPVVHKVWDDNTAILSGDAMLILAYRYLADSSAELLHAILTLFNETALEICEGQQMDMEFERRHNVAIDEYIEMIRLKTAVLLAASLKIGALLGGATQQDADLLYDFGIHIGIAFQLQDDWLDVYGDAEVFGKKIGGDICCNKKTFMLIKAIERADEVQRAQIEEWMNTDNFDEEEKIAIFTDLYNQLGVRKIAENQMDECYIKAMECLDRVGVPTENKQVLKSIISDLMKRKI